MSLGICFSISKTVIFN